MEALRCVVYEGKDFVMKKPFFGLIFSVLFNRLVNRNIWIIVV
jgi:hypothetical protein